MTAAIILGAGAATRMGRLKQLLPYGGGTLLGHAVQQAMGAGFEPVLVVVGAEADAVRDSLARQPVITVSNPEWQSGMGSSISAGVRWLSDHDIKPDAIAILLGDQPLIESRHLQAMENLLQDNEDSAIGAEYGGTVGVPAIFKPEMFGQLAALSPAEGARRLLRHPQFNILSYPLPEAETDLDTPEDVARLPAISFASAEPVEKESGSAGKEEADSPFRT